MTIAPIVPPIVLFLAKHPLVDKYNLSSVEEVISGAAPMGEGLEEALVKRMPLVKTIRQGRVCFSLEITKGARGQGLGREGIGARQG